MLESPTYDRKRGTSMSTHNSDRATLQKKQRKKKKKLKPNHANSSEIAHKLAHLGSDNGTTSSMPPMPISRA